MKTLFIFLIALSPLSSFGFHTCVSDAVRAAKEQSRTATRVFSLETLPVQKNYLRAFRVTLVDNIDTPQETRVYRVALLTSDCTVVSLLPEL